MAYLGNSPRTKLWNVDTPEEVDAKVSIAVAALVDSAPSTLNTLNELAASLGDDANFATSISTSLGTKVDKTTTVNGHALSGNVTVTKSDVSLGNVDNTADSAKPVSTAQQTALNLKSNSASPTFTGTVVLPSTTSIGNVSNTEISYLDGVTSAIQTQLGTKANLATIDNHIGLSGITAYHLLQGNLAVDNTVTTQGFNTTLYTGNGSTQSISTSIDMSTQWGNDVSEQFGGLVWLKGRSSSVDHYLFDTARGVQKGIWTSLTDAQYTYSNALSLFNNNGFTLGSETGTNYSAITYASWNFQTTHRVSGTTNHGKAYTCHFNPFTGFTIVKYEGSGIAGHEIPHHLGRKLGFVTIKILSAVQGWITGINTLKGAGFLQLNLTDAFASQNDISNNWFPTSLNTDTTICSGANNILDNTSTNQYIMYGWANSYIDKSNKLIGNYEVGVYQGTGASGNKVVTKGKPAWIMIKRLDSTGNWRIYDILRNNFDNVLYPNLSNAEGIVGDFDIQLDGFTCITSSTDTNASGGQYLYMVAYDTNSNGGGSYYPRATDTSNLNISNAIIPYANGVDGNGSKITSLSKNETISGLTLTAGKNYVYSKNDGTYGVSKYAPCYGLVPTRTKAGETPDFYDIVKNKWFTTTGGSELVTNGTFDSNTNGWTSGTTTPTWDKGTMKLNTSDWFHTSFTVSPYTKYTLVINRAVGTESNTLLTIGEGNLSYPSVIYINAIYLSGGYSRIEFTTQNTTQVGIYLYCNSAGVSYFDNISVFEATPTIGTEITTSRNYLNHIVYADNDGSPLYVEELPKVEYKDVIKANEYRGKNACTAWVNFDGTTTPPTIRDSYNVSSVVRVGTGIYDVYFTTPMDNANYSINGTCDPDYGNNLGTYSSNTNKCNVTVKDKDDANRNVSRAMVQILGGKN